MVVYPRWRGELNIGNGFAAAASGLSPLARGTHKLSADLKSGTRFIPAGAGNTSKNLKSKPLKTVYPRWRGEHRTVLGFLGDFGGLSPLARGTHISVINRDFRLRFIPAGAGNTAFIYAGVSLLSVYPRWRGEHPEITLNWLSVSGLSPLARGTPRLGVRVGIIGRFIPAGAGNTWSWWKPTVPVAVYPRWRGEHRSPSRVVYVIVGLSPLARGTPH